LRLRSPKAANSRSKSLRTRLDAVCERGLVFVVGAEVGGLATRATAVGMEATFPGPAGVGIAVELPPDIPERELRVRLCKESLEYSPVWYRNNESKS
jgi:hypothetical protein